MSPDMGVRGKFVFGLGLLAIIAVLFTLSVLRQSARPTPVSCAAEVQPVAHARREPDEPVRPLRRDGFERLFQAGLTVRAGEQDAVVEAVDVDQLDLPTGRLVAYDPTSVNVNVPPTPFLTTVPPGRYQVSLARVRFVADAEHSRVAAAKLSVRPDPVVRWELALVAGQDPAKLGPRTFFGYGVDSGYGAFFDASAVSAVCRLLGDMEGPLMDALVRDVDSAGASVRDSVSGLNVTTFASGWGDGSYPTWIGYTADGEVAQFVTDFLVID
jgi:hypothetical protein